MNAKIDVRELQSKVKEMYRDVATNPRGSFHFEMGRALAQRLGYPASDLDWVPAEAIESFAGVGHFFHLAALQPGEIVIDLGSGSGTDSFIAALKVGANGRVVGIDMTREQLAKAERLRRQHDFRNLAYLDGYIEETGLEPDTADCVISNGVINLVPDKARVFDEAAHLLRPGGRLAIADIVTDLQLPDSIVCNTDLWAACIGGAAQLDRYLETIERAGFAVREVQENREYRFLSEGAQAATQRFGVKSVSILAVKSG